AVARTRMPLRAPGAASAGTVKDNFASSLPAGITTSGAVTPVTLGGSTSCILNSPAYSNCRATFTTTSVAAPALALTFGALSESVATAFGSTTIVTGVVGSTTLAGCLFGALGSLLYGICVVALSATVYVPG